MGFLCPSGAGSRRETASTGCAAPAFGGLRFTRGYIPAPRWGEGRGGNGWLLPRQPQVADEFGDVGAGLFADPFFEAFGDVVGAAGVGEEGGAELDGGCAGEDELGGVLPGHDAAEGDEGGGWFTGGAGGGVEDAVCVVDVLEGDGVDGWPGEAAGDVGEFGGACVHVDGHGGVGVAEGERIGAGVDGGAADVLQVGRGG